MKNKYIITFVLIALLPFVTNAKEEKLSLWYDSPSTLWTDALPVGNGKLGAMVYGNVNEEHIQFNEETLWNGEPQTYIHKGASKYLKQIQDLLFEGKQKEAEALANKNFMSVPLQQRAYQPFGDLFIKFIGHDNYSNYHRELDLNNAVQTISYKVGNTTFYREIIASYPKNILAIKLYSDKKGALDFDYNLTSVHEKKSVSVKDKTISLNVSVSDGLSDWINVPYHSVLFGNSKVKIMTDGRVIDNEKSISVRGATYATLYLTAATNYKKYNDISGKPELLVDEILSKVAKIPYEKIKKEHIAEYKSLFGNFKIDFPSTVNSTLPTDKRLESYNTPISDPSLVALYVQYGRYLLISSSRKGTYPATLQGIWNKDLKPAWDSKYTTNINCEMNYWLAESTNLSSCHEALFKLIEEVAETGKVTAKEHYNARGWVLHHNTDIWRGTAPINNANHGIFLGGGGWMVSHMWEHYLYTMDKEFLKNRAYPLMKGAAEFYCDVLRKDPKTGWLVSTPSNSPENGGLVYGPSMDHQIIRSLFKACIKADSILNIDKEFSTELSQKLSMMAPDQVGKFGQLQEWVDDIDDITSKHRHVSHLWGVYPGNEVNWSNPKLMNAAIQSLNNRGDGGNGWSLAWKIALWARFKQPERVNQLIHNLFTEEHKQSTAYDEGGGTYRNLFCAHPPFQIDGNFGAPAGIMEMLIQSQTDRIELLPALPKAFDKGSISSAKVRGGYELSFSWDKGKVTKLEITSLAGGVCHLLYNGKEVNIATKTGKKYHLN